MKISTILDKIDELQLFVPAFQREYVWKRDNAKKLMESLIKEHPTGTMLTWETNQPPELKGPHRYDAMQGAVRLLLDGQQRVTTLYMLIRGTIPPYYTSADITNDTRGLYINVETQELEYYTKAKMETNPCWKNITEIFQKRVWVRDIAQKLEERGETVDRERERSISDNIKNGENILDREFPEQTIPIKASVREAIDIFYMVNDSGVALTEAELALAQISGYWPEVRDSIKTKLAELQKSGFDFKLDFIVYVLLGCLYHQGQDMSKLHDPVNNDSIRETWHRLSSQVLDYVVNIMRSKAFVDHTKEINSIYALVPIIVYCYDRNGQHLSDSEINKMIKWFFYSQIRARYVNQLQQKLSQDLRVIQESSNPFDSLLATIAEENRLEITPEEFIGRSISHPLFGLMCWYFKSQRAMCFSTGVSLHRPMGRRYQLENDHIFPFSRLKSLGYGRGNRIKYQLAQEMTNRAILTQTANRTKSFTAAQDYLPNVKLQFPDALALQCVPEDESLWHIDNYEEFLSARRRLLASELNAFLQGITATEETTSAISLEDLIAEGESDELELKSSLRWDYQEERLNRKLEEVVVKSIAAFANSDGGILLIGVDDDGELLGLAKDYLTFEDGDSDKFELHLRNLLSNQLGVTYVSTNLHVSFPSPNEYEICQVEIQAAAKPKFITLPDNNGQRKEHFYVRNGNKSEELPLGEMPDYLKARFPSEIR